MFAGIPQCPPKTFDPRSPESVERARVELSMWVIQLLHHHPIFTSHVFVDFVSAEANVRVCVFASSSRRGGCLRVYWMGLPGSPLVAQFLLSRSHRPDSSRTRRMAAVAATTTLGSSMYVAHWSKRAAHTQRRSFGSDRRLTGPLRGRDACTDGRDVWLGRRRHTQP